MAARDLSLSEAKCHELHDVAKLVQIISFCGKGTDEADVAWVWSIDRATNRPSDSATSVFKWFPHLGPLSGHPINLLTWKKRLESFPKKLSNIKASRDIQNKPLFLFGLAVDETNDRPIDRSIDRASKRPNQLSHTGRFPLMGWWGIAKRIEYTYGFLYVYVYVYVLVYVLMYVYVSICT